MEKETATREESTGQTEQATVLGSIIGKSTTREFSFQVENETKVFEYLKVFHRAFGDVLCQVVEITTTRDDTTALCEIIGYRDEDGAIKTIRIPFDVGSRVLRADDGFIREIIKISSDHGALLGKLEGRDINVALDLRKILTKHVAVLAKSGAGKSYSVGVLIEEILEKGVPVVIIDPHGEYTALQQPNTVKEDVERLTRFGLQPKGYAVNEYGDPTVSSGRPLKLSNQMTQQELVQMIPAKLTGTQIGILYSALRNIDQISFDTVIASLNAEESNAKWGLINILEHLRTYNIFTSDPTPYDEIVAPGVCSIINLRGIPAEIQSIIVFKMTKDLFDARKRGTLPPFFLVLEEAHNFCPERSFGETTASKTIRTIAAEGRKFGLGLCVISQRPARIDKSVVSQCSTQVILKVTNPNDLKAISASVEGLTAEAEKEIANLPIGTALVTGIVEVPLLINIRPRRSLHGGKSVDIFAEIQEASQRPRGERLAQGRLAQAAQAATASTAPTATIPKATATTTMAIASTAPSASLPQQQTNTTRREQRTNEERKASTVSTAVPSPTASPTASPPRQQASAPIGRPTQPIPLLKPKKGIMDQLLKDKPISSVRQTLVPAYLATCTQGTDQFRLVVERLEGCIVTSIDSFTTKRIPDLKKLSKEEIKALQTVYTAKSVGADLQQDPALQSLVDKGYLTQQPDGIKLSEKYLFQRLSKVKSDDDLEFTRVTDAAMIAPALSENDVRMTLAPFVTVKNITECYVLRIQVN